MLAHERLSAQGLSGTLRVLVSTLLPGTSPDSQVPGGKQGLSLNPIVCADSLGSESRSYHLGDAGILLSWGFPGAASRPFIK